MKIEFLLILSSASLLLSGCGQSPEEKQHQERIAKTEAMAAEMAARAATNPPAVQVEVPVVKNQINASITFSDDRIMILNDNNFDWPVLNVYINGMPSQGYGLRIRALKQTESVTINLTDFTKQENGEIFNPSAYRVTQLWIGGGDFDYVKYAN